MRNDADDDFDACYAREATPLADGQFAVVYRATCRATGHATAVKAAGYWDALPPSPAGAPAAPERAGGWVRPPSAVQLLRHERALLHAVGPHPHLVRPLDFFECSVRAALVLELCAGGDLQQLLAARGPLGEGAVGAVAAQLRGALAHVHARGVLHRDVKLENVLVCAPPAAAADDGAAAAVDAAPRVKLCDFGHAMGTAQAEGEGRRLLFYGTAGYAAPEVAYAPPARDPRTRRLAYAAPRWSERADVYSLGVVAYALLTNYMPYRGGDDWAAPLDLLSQPWPRVSLRGRLLLRSLLEPDGARRGTLRTLAQSGEIWGEPGGADRSGAAEARGSAVLAARLCAVSG
jgi:serine/threonine protein kinase